jgi:hypothetical protein
VLTTQSVALQGAEHSHVETEHFTHASLRDLNPGEQRQQCAFATTAGALDKQMLALRQRQMGNVKQGRATRPSMRQIR